MNVNDAAVLAEAQVDLVLEEGGLMTMRRLSEVAGDWSDSSAEHAAVLQAMWGADEGD